MAEQEPTATKTNVPQDGASRIIRKLDSIDRKLGIILWIIAIPFVYAAIAALMGVIALASR